MSFRSILVIISIVSIFFTSILLADDVAPANIQIFFSPGDECAKTILEKINSAQKSIEIAMYSFTSRELSHALIATTKKGIRVRVFLDGENAAERYSKANYMKKNGVNVKLEKGEGLMHNKFCIIDDELVITGSYNWTTSADLANDENLIFINSKEIAKVYRKQFEKYWSGAYVDKARYTNKRTLSKH